MVEKETTVGNRLTCPFCDNDIDFFVIAEDAIITTHYKQNIDGSFTEESQESEILGETKFFCSSCGEDLPHFQDRFREMLF